MSREWGFATKAIHAGQEPDKLTGAITTPIYQTSTYIQSDIGKPVSYEYARTDNPTRTALQECLSDLENAYGTLVFSSGMSAIATVMYTLKSGDHLLVDNDLYGGTYRLFSKVLSNYQISFDLCDMSNLQNIKNAIKPNTKMIWLESPTNPLLKILDIKAIAQIKPRPLFVVDNTFASPYLQQPLSLGADVSIYSTTKYIAGHSDVIGGAITTNNRELYDKLKFLQNAVGAIPGPLDVFLILRGIKTLAIRMEKHCSNALSIAQFLEQHPKIKKVIYPGLKSHPQYELAKKQMRHFGGIISFQAEGGYQESRKIVKKTKLFALAESLGGIESLIELPAKMTHMATKGSTIEIPQNLIRLSVGIEDEADLINDIKLALE